MKMSVKKYNHSGEAFHAYFKCKWPLSALSEPYLMSDITGGSVEEIRMTFFLNMAATSEYFYSLLLSHYLLARNQSPELRPMSPHYLNASSKNLFTEKCIMSITNSSVFLQTGLSFLQSFTEGSFSKP